MKRAPWCPQGLQFMAFFNLPFYFLLFVSEEAAKSRLLLETAEKWQKKELIPIALISRIREQLRTSSKHTHCTACVHDFFHGWMGG